MIKIHSLTVAAFIATFFFIALPAYAQNDWCETSVQMCTIDDLDRPQDGLCLDAVGNGPHIRFEEIRGSEHTFIQNQCVFTYASLQWFV